MVQMAHFHWTGAFELDMSNLVVGPLGEIKREEEKSTHRSINVCINYHHYE